MPVSVLQSLYHCVSGYACVCVAESLYHCVNGYACVCVVESHINEMASMGIGNKPCMDIKPSRDNINERSLNVSIANRGREYQFLHAVFVSLTIVTFCRT